MIYITKPSLPSFDKYVNIIKRIWKSNHLANRGELETELEDMLAKYLNVEHIVLTSSGTMSLLLILMHLKNITDKTDIITTPFTFPATTHMIKMAGFNPVFCDIISATEPNLSPIFCENMITENTAGILPVHLYGTMCDVITFESISKKYNVPIIYDSSHSFGCKYLDKSLLEFGNFSATSFHATKVYSTAEGGCIICKTEEEKIILNKLKNFGYKNKEEVEYLGINGKMNEFEAAYGISKLEEIDSDIKKRKEKYNLYKSCLINIETINHNCDTNYSYFPIIIENRDIVHYKLEQENIFARKYFSQLTSKLFEDHSDYPNAERLSKTVLCLPLYPDLSDEDIQRICRIVNNESK